MFLPITPHNVMTILVTFIIGIVFLHWLWPWCWNQSLRWFPSPEKRMGNFTILLFCLSVVALYLVLKYTNQKEWLSNEPAVTAIAVIGALFFTYSRFFPPRFGVVFRGTNLVSGLQTKKSHNGYKVTVGVKEPMCLNIHNLGLTPWKSYRISIRFEEGIDVYPIQEVFPDAAKWSWFSENIQFNPGIRSLQVNRQGLITLGEPHIIRFAVQSNMRGQNRFEVAVSCDDKLGESTRSFVLDVEPQHAKQEQRLQEGQRPSNSSTSDQEGIQRPS